MKSTPSIFAWRVGNENHPLFLTRKKLRESERVEEAVFRLENYNRQKTEEARTKQQVC
jgi:hypothetical protein